MVAKIAGPVWIHPGDEVQKLKGELDPRWEDVWATIHPHYENVYWTTYYIMVRYNGNLYTSRHVVPNEDLTQLPELETMTLNRMVESIDEMMDANDRS